MSVSQAGREFLIRDTSAPPPNQLMQYGPRLKEESPAIPVPSREPDLIPGVESPDNQSCSRTPKTQQDSGNQCASWRMFTLRAVALFANLDLGMGKDSVMIATRPPGGSVFLVEDEVMIRMMVADMLEELGYSVVAEAGEISEAIRLAQSAQFDLAILDVNVNGKVISPVAELIDSRNIPFVFATGYGSSGLPEEYRDRPALQKPFQVETLGRMIEVALKRATV
jgi:CheY-like chemotaxis protein